MIEITNTEVTGWRAAIRGMRNPLNSHDKDDSVFCSNPYLFATGCNNLTLMNKLVAAGNDHSKFMRYIIVTCDVNAPRYWWIEADTYKIATVSNSCSTMHTIHKKEFTLDDFSHEHLDGMGLDNLKHTIDVLNAYRDRYLETKNKDDWYTLIQLLPQSYNQLRTWQANYAVLRNIYHARKNHKLTEWYTFCKWIEQLPYSELIIMDREV